MQRINTISEANRELAKYVLQSKLTTGKNMTVERMLPLLNKVGNPHESLKVVHIAGTSGKTSTAYYISKMLTEAGLKVGLTVSPHIDSVTERVQINSIQLSEDDFCKYLTEFLGKIDGIEPTYFELMIAFSFWVFAKLNVDYVVLETGLGGLHDSTNAARRKDKVCVITDIGYDHMNILGSTLSEIATQKAGIIHEKNKTFIYEQSKEVMRVVKTQCRSSNAPLHVLKESELKSETEKFSETIPLFQQRNWLLAKQVFEHLRVRDNLPNLSREQYLNSRTIQVPGRMETRNIGNKTIVMDGAHNQQKIRAFVQSFKSKYPDKKAVVLLSLKQDKEYKSFMNELLPIVDRLIITAFSTTQDMISNSMNPKDISQYCFDNNFQNLEIITDPKEAVGQLLKSSEDLLVITGSFYFLSQIRALL